MNDIYLLNYCMVPICFYTWIWQSSLNIISNWFSFLWNFVILKNCRNGKLVALHQKQDKHHFYDLTLQKHHLLLLVLLIVTEEKFIFEIFICRMILNYMIIMSQNVFKPLFRLLKMKFVSYSKKKKCHWLLFLHWFT